MLLNDREPGTKDNSLLPISEAHEHHSIYVFREQNRWTNLVSTGLCVKDLYALYPEERKLANKGSRFQEHKLAERSGKGAGMGTEEYNDHNVVSINDAKDEF